MESSEVISRDAHTNLHPQDPTLSLSVSGLLWYLQFMQGYRHLSSATSPSFPWAPCLLFPGLFQAHALAVKKQVEQTALHILPIARPSPLFLLAASSVFLIARWQWDGRIQMLNARMLWPSGPVVGRLAAASEIPCYPAGNSNMSVFFMLLKKTHVARLANYAKQQYNSFAIYI